MTRAKSLTLAALVLVSALAGTAAAASMTGTIDSPDKLNHDATPVPNPQISADVKKDVHRVGWSPTAYEGDNGDKQSLPATVNSSQANPHSLIASDINASEFGEFPRKSAETGDNTASALDASEWTKDVSGTAGSASIADTTTAPGVDAVSLSTSSQGSGDTAKFTYDNFSIDSDVDKRYVQLVVDVQTLDSGADVHVRFKDSDGDYVELTADSSLSESNSTVIANATGEGDVLQEQVGSMAVEGSGDGSMSSITSVVVVVEDADADLDIAALNAEKMGEWTFGSQAYDGSDDDSDKDQSRDVTEPHGRYSVETLAADSFSGGFDDARLLNVETAMEFRASALSEDMDAMVNFSAADDRPGYAAIADVYYRLQLPSAYDLSYSNARLEDTVAMPESRYTLVEISEGVSDTDFGDVASWTAKTSLYDTQGANVTLDSTIQPGDQIAIHYEELLTEEEQNQFETAGGGAGQFSQDGGGGLFGGVFGWVAGIIGTLLGGKWLMGK